METNTKYSRDSRSIEEKVNDLSDIFVGEHHIDRDVIEVVLGGCDGNVNKATEKLIEIVNAGKKAKGRQRNEDTDLAVIACSILADESVNSSDEGHLGAALHSTEEKFRNVSTESCQIVSDREERRVHNHKPLVILPHRNSAFSAPSYNFYSNSIDKKPCSEAKRLFQPDNCSQDFLAKNSFEDMARNMEHNAFVSSKTLGRSLSKEENYLRLGAEKNNNFPSNAKLDRTETPFRSLPADQRNISVKNDGKIIENNSFHPIDLCSDPVASVSANNISPDVSAEWNAFYKELNLEPISDRPFSSDLDITKLVNNPVSKDSEKSFAFSKNRKSTIPVLKESDMNLIRQEKDFGELNTLVKGNFSKACFLSLVSPDDVRNPTTETVERGRKSSGSRQSQCSDESISSQSVPQSHSVTKEKNNDNVSPPPHRLSPHAPIFNMTKENDNVSPPPDSVSAHAPIFTMPKENDNVSPPPDSVSAHAPIFTMPKENDNVSPPPDSVSAHAPIFTPVAMENTKNTPGQHRIKAVPTPQSLELMTMTTNKNLKTIKKQLQQQQEQISFKESVNDTHKKAVGIEHQAFEKSASQKPPQENLSSPNESNVGPYDPFGWGEITDIISSKSQPQRTQKSRKPATTSSSKGSEVKTGPVSHEEDQNWSGENSVCMSHRPSLQSNQITSDSCVPDISVSSTRTVIPKKSKRPSLNLQNLGEASSLHTEVPVTVRKGSSKTSSPKLPPSLAIKPPVHPPSSQLLNTAPTKLLSKGPSMIKKTSSSQEVCRNKVELVGFKTPRGMLRHYLLQEHPVVIILRGLPGSGKSYLARELMQEIIKANQRGVVLSTDDYFVQSGQYEFNRQSLDLAHAWNKQRALESMKKKLLFIIIDNTNTTLWELLPYAEMAIQHRYDVRVCEPDTPWKNKLQELSRKNEHGVPKENIKRMKERYETLTTERVVQEACKSLAARGKLTQLIQDGYEKVPQKAKTNREEPKTPDVNTKTEKPQIHVENQNTKNVSTAPMLPEFGITEWTSPKEQRKPVLRIEKGLVPKDPSDLCPTSPGLLITLEYLNNSLKEVILDSGRVEKESPSLKDQPENQDSVIELSSEKGLLSTTSTADGNVSVDHENLLTASQLKEVFLRKNERETAGERNEKKEESLVDELKAEFVTRPSHMKTSKSADELSNCAKDLQSTLNNRKLGSPFSPRDLSPVNSQGDDYFSPGLESSGASSSFHSCKSEEENNEGKEGGIDGVKPPGDGDIDSDATTPSTVVDAMEFKLTNVSKKASDLKTFKSGNSGNDQMNLFVQRGELPEDKTKLQPKDNMKNKEHMSELTLTAGSSNLECVVRKLSSFTGSLVQYDDSEEDANGDGPMVPRPSEAGELMKMVEEKTDWTNSSPVTVKSDASENIEERGNTLPETYHEDNSTGHEVEISKELNDKGDGMKSTSESLTSSREQSPHPSSDMSDYSPGKKLKKKRIRKGRNRGPFFEETLVAASKTKNWHSFMEKPQVDSASSSIDGTETVEIPSVEMISENVQCEPYYFTMVYRLNSTAFSEEPVDVSVCDVTVIQISDQIQNTHSHDDYKIVTRKPNMCDQSTMTDETLNTEEVDLYILHNCFPAYSRKCLEEVMSVCGNNLDWVTSHLIDSPPLTDTGDQEVVSKDWEKETETSSSVSDNCTHQAMESLASLAMDIVKKNTQVDPDDLELQVIKAGQLRLQCIERFGKEGLLNVSQEKNTSDGWVNDFRYNYFSGPLTPEECWEWNPTQDDLNTRNKPLSPPSSSSPADSRSLTFHSPASPLWPTSPLDRNPFADLSGIRNKNYEVSVRSKQFLRRSVSQPIGRRPRDEMKNEPGQKKQQQSPQAALAVEDQDEAMPTAPVLPHSFIHCLENMFGPLGLQLDNQGLLLDDRIAKKIFNCLKLQSTKTLTFSHDNEQLKEDEALARAIQEEEDARIANSMSLGDDSIGSRPGEKTPHADHSSHGVGEEQPGPQDRLNSVSDILHHLRGSTPKRPKPYRCLSRAPNAAPSSVWANQVKRNSSSNFHSIVEEEKAREAHDTRQMQLLRATGDSDALATKLKRQELSRKYPMVPSDLLEEIFMSNLYSIETTERALAHQYEISPVAQTNDIHQTLMEDAFKRSHAENYRNGSSCRPQFQQWPDDDGVQSYDDLRREAQMYRNLGKECQQKAQGYHRDMPSAAFFFRQEVKRYKSEEQNANQRAASVLFDRGSERLRRENTLDLHSFHLDEALKAVNSAIEMKREEFQLRPERRNTFLNIITGRGRNSKGGIPRLKPAVHAYLHDRHLKFEEKTPGMLKVYVFPRD